jgi:hypothetical protein
MSLQPIICSENKTKYIPESEKCDICDCYYRKKHRSEHMNSFKHLNHKNNIKNNPNAPYIETLLQTKNTLNNTTNVLNTLNTIIDEVLKNSNVPNPTKPLNDNYNNSTINNIPNPSQQLNNDSYEYKLNNIKKWQQDIFKK